MKHKKKVVPLAAAAVVHGLCPTETGKHEHVPNEITVDSYSLAAKTAIMGTTTAVSGLQLVDLANPSSVFKRPRAGRSAKRSRR